MSLTSVSRPRRGVVVIPCLVVCLLVSPGNAIGSKLIDRDATNVVLQLNDKGEALLSYHVRSTVRHVLVWGAVNATPSSAETGQVDFEVDYSGGFRKYFLDDPRARSLAAEYAKIKGTPGYLASPIVRELQHVQHAADSYWQTGFHGGCGRYSGPAVPLAVVTCTAPDGSYWAVQEWQRVLPDYGVNPTNAQAVWELRLSHWTGDFAVLTVHTDWAWHKWDHLYGSLTYRGQPVYGFHSTSSGNPLDSYGRNVYIDTRNSAYGPGWRRENSVLTHNPTGVFCYSVDPHAGRPAGTGAGYRITVIGPGVTPDVAWEGAAPGTYNPALDRAANEQISEYGDRLCRPN
jgi:hypothetical protein